MVKTFRLPEFNYEVEIGKVARQADGSVWLQKGATTVLATVVGSPSKDFPGFLPLTVEYREQFAAAGKIPGGYYKREGKPSDREVLTARLIDRAIRPLFPENYFDQTQVVITVYSVDKEHSPQTMGLIAASLALSISPLPFMGPVGVVEVGRLDGKWVIDPRYSESKKSEVRLIVAGTHDGICMVEGSSKGLAEHDFVDALFLAHDKVRDLVKWQTTITQEVGKPKEEIDDPYNWSSWQQKIQEFITADHVKNSYIADKAERNAYLKGIREEFVTQHEEELTKQEIPTKVINYIFDLVLKSKVTELIFEAKKRVDGRAFDQVRDISIEVGLLESTHGSALFTRGQTQALVSLTLGDGQDEQRLESIMEDETNSNFMLHYNFPPFSVGEARPMRGPGRREIGHGHLAASAIRPVLPEKKDFPYTIRLVSDILESNGSSSMATVCGSIMALMDGGIPIEKMVSGIAMGLLQNKDGDLIILSDITGFEDAFGLMDFKVAGTQDGVTAIQMDVKLKGGLSRNIFESAMKQALEGRQHILGEMKKTMESPRKELSDLVPKLISFTIDTDKIGAVIGGGGKIIREIIEKTGTTIDIESDGMVKIFGGTGSELDKAVRWVKTLAGEIEVGSIYDGTIRRIVEFGIFVELVPGLDGLLHVSNIPREKQKTFARDYTVGDKATVEVVGYDRETGRIRLRIKS